MHVDAVRYDDVVRSAEVWSAQPVGRYICVSNVHMVMESKDSPEMQAAVNGANLVVPDGMPLVWILRQRGYTESERVRGAPLVFRLCEWAASKGIPVGFLGGGPGVVESMTQNLRHQIPALKIAFQRTPPYFTRVVPDARLIEEINESGALILFVGLGCPKQELWMAAHVNSIKATMVGVGNAFDLHAGRVRDAPKWMQQSGLEWIFRLTIEPRRLWRRYLVLNPRFVFHLAMESLRLPRSRS
jgi:N-acetylglucosaminyldiphosphoundecaprenol N-acetyl-beta-D-mannosaminyltransferase